VAQVGTRSVGHIGYRAVRLGAGGSCGAWEARRDR
jgi:hypothetical protein